LIVWLTVCAELVIRTAFYEQLKIKRHENSWAIDSLLGYMPEPESSFYLIDENIDKEIPVNKYGFYDANMRMLKPEGYFRIAVIGNGLETGHMGTANFNWIEKCKEMFQNNNHKIECANFSLSDDYADYTRIMTVKHRVLKFMPDMIIMNINIPVKHKLTARETYNGVTIEYNLNDRESEIQLKKEIDKLKKLYPLFLLYKSSYILRGICQIKTKKNVHINQSELWEKMKIYISGYKSSDKLILIEFSEAESIKLINDLYGELCQREISLCLINKYNINKNLLNNNIQLINSDYYYELSGEYENQPSRLNETSTARLAKELYNILTDSLVPKQYISDFKLNSN